MLTRQQPDDVPVLLTAHTIQQVAHVEHRMLEQLGHGLATLTPMAWVDVFHRRFSLRQQQQRPQSNSFIRLQTAVPTEFFAIIAFQVAAAHFQDFPILSHLCSQPGRCYILVRFCAPLVAAQLVRLAVNSLPALRLPPVRSRLTCGQPRRSTFLLPRFVFALAQCHFCAPVTLHNSHCSHLSCVVTFVDAIHNLWYGLEFP